MMRKTLIAALGVMGLVAAGAVVSATPAAAGYACGPWNGWCAWYGKGYGWKGYGSRFRSGYDHGHWGSHRGHGGKHYKHGNKRHHADKRSRRHHR